MRCRTLVAGIGLALTTASCSVESTTTGPTSNVINLAGTWAGDLAVQGTTARMTWTLTQSGSSVSGPVLVMLPNGIVLLNGALSGTINGNSLTYTINVASGGIPSQPGCTGQLGGGATAAIGTPSTLAGNYNVTSSSCTVPLASTGTFTLTRT
jgi:hypothetical protein